MKALTLIPKQIKKDYLIRRYEDCITVNSPAFVNINFDDHFKIEEMPDVISIENNICKVQLFRNTKMMHVTIYK